MTRLVPLIALFVSVVTASDCGNSALNDAPPFSINLLEDPLGAPFVYKFGWCKKYLNDPPTCSVSPCLACGQPVYAAQYDVSADGRCLYNVTTLERADVTVNRTTLHLSGLKDGVKWGFNVEVNCDPTKDTPVVDQGKVYEDRGNYMYSVKMTYKYGCTANPSGGGGGGDGGLSGGAIFLIIFFCGAAVYLIVGSVIGYTVKELRGVQVIPHLEFWKDAPFLVRDGAVFLVGRVKNTVSGSYSSV